MKKIFASLLFVSLILSSCSIDWNDEKDKKIAELQKQVEDLKNEKESEKLSIKRDWNTIEINDYASCKLKLNTTIYENIDNKDILEATSWIQDNSLNINFYNLNNDNPYMESNWWKTNLTKIDNWNYIYLIEETWFWNIVIYTLFKDKWILIMSKQYDLMWAFWTQMIWFCN